MIGYDSTYYFAMLAFQRGIALVYLVAFLVAFHQFPVLHGERGLEPVMSGLGVQNLRRAPSLFHFHYSDRFFRLVAGSGAILAAAALFGVPDWADPRWSLGLSLGLWFTLWGLYLSIVNIGGTFYGFGWESKLLDAGFLAIFLGPAWMDPSPVVVFSIRWLLFRVELGAGLIKMRGDSCWRSLSCMKYHHETQPLPNGLSWHFHHAPELFHKLETLGNHIVQLGVVWLIFAPQPIASGAGLLILVSQLWLLQSGNYSWLNVLTICVAFSTLSDEFVFAWLGLPPQNLVEAPLWLETARYLLLLVVVCLSVPVIKNLASPRQRMNVSYNPLHLVGSYGAFGSVTRERHEIIIEGTNDLDPDENADFRAYEMKGKPGDVRRRPRQIAPYHLRLDWQLWFVPLRPSHRPKWLLVFVSRLLENDRAVLSLLRHNPFPESGPRWIRISLYHYRYTNPDEKSRTGHWWVRTRLDDYLPPVDAAGLRRVLDRG